MDATLEDRLKALLDKQDINDALVRMTRGFNRLDASLVEQSFHDDAIYEHWAFGDLIVGNRAIAEKLITMLKLKQFRWTTHFLLQSHIELKGDVAFSENEALSTQVIENGSDEPTYYMRALRMIHRWERRDGKTWKVAYRVALLDGLELAGVLPNSGYPPEAYGKRNDRDISYHWDEALRPGVPYQWR